MEYPVFNNRPCYQSYEICRGLYAGEYPGDKNSENAKCKIDHMVKFGIKHFIDLTQEGELMPYADFLPNGVSYKRFPIKDVNVPNSVEEVHQLLETIDEYKSRYHDMCYLHCWGGVGRTGTIVACYFAKHSSNPSVEESLSFLRKRFSKMPKSKNRVTPDTMEQVAFIGKYVEYVKQQNEIEKLELVHDSIRGCLMAGAAGDALGYPVKFMGRSYILSQYGGNGITQFDLDNHGKALISSNTQMMLFTANGMLMGITRGAMRGIGGWPEKYVDGAYLDWYYTQTGKKREMLDDFHYTWLRDLPEMAHLRTPESTCLSACDLMYLQKTVNNFSKECGGITRVAPMGLLEAALTAKDKSCYSWKALAEAGANVASVTHHHPLGFLPAALLTTLIKKLALATYAEASRRMEVFVNESIALLDEIFIKESEDEYIADQYKKDKLLLKELSQRAIQLSKSNMSDTYAIRQLGEGWDANEAWAIALYCSMRHIDSVNNAIIASVNHDGNSNATGAITGNIMGAIYGYMAIKEQNLFCTENHKFEEVLELSDIILTIADDLHSICLISEYDPIDTPEKQQWYERYCLMRPIGFGNCKILEPQEL